MALPQLIVFDVPWWQNCESCTAIPRMVDTIYHKTQRRDEQAIFKKISWQVMKIIGGCHERW
jgi:hypothetical protein